MQKLYKLVLAVLVLLAVSSGIAKIMLMPQEVAFFSSIRFTNPILIVFGVIQLIAGAMMVFRRTRFAGALIVYVTFLISAVALVFAGDTIFVIVTLVAMVLLGIVMRKTRVEN